MVISPDSHRGFTLIEVLTVVAIITILMSMVLLALNNARTKGSDAKVKQELNHLRPAAEMVYYNNGNAYGTVQPSNINCPNEAGTLSGDAVVRSSLTAMPSGTTIKCAVSANRAVFAVIASLGGGTAASGNNYWCVDSTGDSRAIGVDTPGNIVLTDTSCTLMNAR